MPDADLSLAVPAMFFGAVGTAGQRCTSTRRLYLHRAIAPDVLARLQTLYAKVAIGDPLLDTTLLGPLHTASAVSTYERALETHAAQGAEILTDAGRVDALSGGNFVRPVIAVPRDADGEMWRTETFAPILSVAVFDELEQAIAWNNAVPQGLSSSLWSAFVG